MKYKEYFDDRIRNFGVPKLNKEQFKRLTDIVFVEGMLTSFNVRDVNNLQLEQKRYRDVKSLNVLTGRKLPEVLWQEMLRLSEK